MAMPPSRLFEAADHTDADLLYVRDRLLQWAEGDAARAEALERLFWGAYCEAGCPLGTDEAGLYRWLAF